MSKICKKDFVDILSEKYKITKNEANGIYTSFCDTLFDALANENEVMLVKVGKLSVVNRAAHSGYDPINKRATMFEAKKAIKFSASSKIKTAINS